MSNPYSKRYSLTHTVREYGMIWMRLVVKRKVTSQAPILDLTMKWQDSLDPIWSPPS